MKVISGTYRGNPVTHYIDPSTGVNVMADPTGRYVSGWQLGAEQLEGVLTTGRLFWRGTSMQERMVTIELTKDEALVFFEWLVRLDESDGNATKDEAEQKVLWTLEGRLEKALSEPLAPNYRELLAAAKRRILDTSE